MEKYEVALLNLTENSEVNTVVYADEAETCDTDDFPTTEQQKLFIKDWFAAVTVLSPIRRNFRKSKDFSPRAWP